MTHRLLLAPLTALAALAWLASALGVTPSGPPAPSESGFARDTIDAAALCRSLLVKALPGDRRDESRDHPEEGALACPSFPTPRRPVFSLAVAPPVAPSALAE
ncbi:hypothetical protein, partial [Rhodospirillum rubrum]